MTGTEQSEAWMVIGYRSVVAGATVTDVGEGEVWSEFINNNPETIRPTLVACLDVLKRATSMLTNKQLDELYGEITAIQRKHYDRAGKWAGSVTNALLDND